MADDKNIPKSRLADAVSTAINVVSYPLGLLSGWFAGDVVIRNNVYKNFVSRGAFGGGSKLLKGVQEGSKDQATQQLQKHMYDTLKANKDRGAFAENYVMRYENAVLEGKHKIKPVIEEAAAKIGKTFPDKFDHVINVKYRSGVRRFFEDMGVNGKRDYWRNITRNQKVETVVFATTAAAITVGAMLAISDHKGLLARLAPDKDQGSDTSRC